MTECAYRLSIIVPALNEAGGIAETLDRLQPLRRDGHEVIVVDGGSVDATVRLAEPRVDRVVYSPPGRARQMNAGAKTASGDILWFVHADTLVPREAVDAIMTSLQTRDKSWGRFDVYITGSHPLLRLVAILMNLRSRLTGIATGDQAIFVRRAVFEAVGGYPDQPLMEDIALSKWLKQYSAPLCLKSRVITSGRRWETHGVVRTILTMWGLRLAFFLGVRPECLATLYYKKHI